jgi:hypothetical protein
VATNTSAAAPTMLLSAILQSTSNTKRLEVKIFARFRKCDGEERAASESVVPTTPQSMASPHALPTDSRHWPHYNRSSLFCEVVHPLLLANFCIWMSSKP